MHTSQSNMRLTPVVRVQQYNKFVSFHKKTIHEALSSSKQLNECETHPLEVVPTLFSSINKKLLNRRLRCNLFWQNYLFANNVR